MGLGDHSKGLHSASLSCQLEGFPEGVLWALGTVPLHSSLFVGRQTFQRRTIRLGLGLGKSNKIPCVRGDAGLGQLRVAWGNGDKAPN